MQLDRQVHVRASIVAGEERAESPVAERECRTGVSQNAGRKRANCDAIGCMRCRAPFIGPHAAACAGAQLPMLLPATVEFYFAGEPAESLPLLLFRLSPVAGRPLMARENPTSRLESPSSHQNVPEIPLVKRDFREHRGGPQKKPCSQTQASERDRQVCARPGYVRRRSQTGCRHGPSNLPPRGH